MLIYILLLLFYYIIYQNGIILNSNKYYSSKNYTKYKYKIEINNNEYLICWYYKLNNNINNKTIIYYPGYFESYNLYFTPNRLKLFTNYPYYYNFITFDYRGIGKSKGKYNENNMLEDSIIIINYILSNKYLNINIKDIILYGYSIGTINVLYTNQILINNNLIPHKIILEAPLYLFSLNKSINFIISNLINYKLKFKILDSLNNIKCPILILHGNKDTIISVNQSKYIINLISKKNIKKYLNYLILNNAGHNNILNYSSSHKIILKFLEKNI
jgi:pimeloyl-ACP methyl ester carboxylesterase